MRPHPVTAFLTIALLASPALALDDAHAAKAGESAKKGVAFLKAAQDPQGSWGAADAKGEGQNPGVCGQTGLALSALLDQGLPRTDPAVKKGVDFLLSKAKPTGEIGEGALQIYNTAIGLSALSRLSDDPQVAQVIKLGQDFLVAHQWQAGMKDPNGNPVTEDHPFFGGSGYGGKHSRPDMSNTQFMLQAMHDTGADCDSPAMKRALVFLQKNQGIASNKALGEKIARDGGFIYSTTISGDPKKNLLGVPESKASPELMDEAANGNRNISGLRTYGSMTYAGFKSYLYARLDRNDERVQAALGWIKKNYSLDGNPGMEVDLKSGNHQRGLYYYYLTFSRALHAWGSAELELADGKKVDWQNDLVDKLAALQKADGSWSNAKNDWMESDPRLVTAYALIALNNALGLEK